MKFLILASLAALASASTIEILNTPSNIKFPTASSSLRSTQLSSLNAFILGLTSAPVSDFDVQTDLFARPRALTTVVVEGLDSLNEDAKSYALTVDGFDNIGFDQDLAISFGADREIVQLNAAGVTGSQLAQTVQEQTVDSSSIKTKIPQLVKELETIYKLVAALKSSSIRTDNAADIYRITIAGLASQTGLSSEETITAANDIKNALAALNSALNNVYGGQSVVEVVCVSAFVKSNATESHRILKRSTGDAVIDKLLEMRNNYQVYSHVSNDFPAIFAIFLGLVVVLVLALIYIVVGMLSMDPGKDSIIYRMTTTRMKKD